MFRNSYRGRTGLSGAKRRTQLEPINIASAYWGIGFYAIGLAVVTLILLAFSSMTIRLENFSRGIQIAIYGFRHLL